MELVSIFGYRVFNIECYDIYKNFLTTAKVMIQGNKNEILKFTYTNIEFKIYNKDRNISFVDTDGFILINNPVKDSTNKLSIFKYIRIPLHTLENGQQKYITPVYLLKRKLKNG